MKYEKEEYYQCDFCKEKYTPTYRMLKVQISICGETPLAGPTAQYDMCYECLRGRYWDSFRRILIKFIRGLGIAKQIPKIKQVK